MTLEEAILFKLLVGVLPSFNPDLPPEAKPSAAKIQALIAKLAPRAKQLAAVMREEIAKP